ncbi:hypothetical protein EPYR_01185 [Erwinia pyrifoliae DSM 12163]|nr:hypothetical protein EPYR_01185 [Erwinia pyrifoliae DSM 12163]
MTFNRVIQQDVHSTMPGVAPESKVHVTAVDMASEMRLRLAMLESGSLVKQHNVHMRSEPLSGAYPGVALDGLCAVALMWQYPS